MHRRDFNQSTTTLPACPYCRARHYPATDGAVPARARRCTGVVADRKPRKAPAGRFKHLDALLGDSLRFAEPDFRREATYRAELFGRMSVYDSWYSLDVVGGTRERAEAFEAGRRAEMEGR